jgi:hypothetical protein
MVITLIPLRTAFFCTYARLGTEYLGAGAPGHPGKAIVPWAFFDDDPLHIDGVRYDEQKKRYYSAL